MSAATMIRAESNGISLCRRAESKSPGVSGEHTKVGCPGLDRFKAGRWDVDGRPGTTDRSTVIPQNGHQ
jgi:hypothetical protein